MSHRDSGVIFRIEIVRDDLNLIAGISRIKK